MWLLLNMVEIGRVFLGIGEMGKWLVLLALGTFHDSRSWALMEATGLGGEWAGQQLDKQTAQVTETHVSQPWEEEARLLDIQQDLKIIEKTFILSFCFAHWKDL